jgi:Pentapeptide repeats (8 copies)
LHDVRFAASKLDGANLRMSEADRIVVDHINLRGAEFSAGRLASACFFDCDLGGADFSHVVMPEARLHGSSPADIRGSEYLRDIVVDSSQVLPLALRVFAGLGIRMEDERETPGSTSEASG